MAQKQHFGSNLTRIVTTQPWLIAKIVFGIHFVLWVFTSYFSLIPLYMNYDAGIYRRAAFQIGQLAPVYWVDIQWPNLDPYYYSPQFVWGLSWFNGLDNRTFAYLFGLLVLLIPFLLSLIVWQKLAVTLKVDSRTFYQWLPLALLATDTIANFFYGNIVLLLTALLGVGLYAAFRQKSVPLAIVLVIMLLTKPQFFTPLIVVLLFCLPDKTHRRFALRTVLYAAGFYIGISVMYLLAVGPTYGLQLMIDYIRFLLQGTSHYPFTTDFITVNNAFEQQFYRVGLGSLAGISTLIKLSLAGYYVVLLYSAFRAKIRLTTHGVQLVMLALMAYLVTFSFTWAFWELLVAPIMLAFLVSVNAVRKWEKWVLVLLIVWELILPVVFVVPTLLICLFILMRAGSRFLKTEQPVITTHPAAAQT